MKIYNIDFEKADFCPECGAPLTHNMNCYGLLGAIISWEYDDPDLLSEHFKTVSCYNLQHPAKFTEEAIEGLKKVFIEHLDNGLTVEQIRKIHAQSYGGNKRVLKDASKMCPVEPGQKPKMTIADVYSEGCKEKAAQRVRKRAESIREELRGETEYE